MLTGIVYPNRSIAPGEVADVPAEDARRLIAAGLAEPVDAPKRERATRSKRETAVKPEPEER